MKANSQAQFFQAEMIISTFDNVLTIFLHLFYTLFDGYKFESSWKM